MTNSIPLGIPDPLNLVRFLGSLSLCMFLIQLLHTDVSNTRTHRVDDRCNADASVLD